jgi:hypothetical protein
MAGRGDRLLKKFAEALALGMAPVQASEMAGYPRGRSDKTYSANARKRAGTKRVKDMVAELQKPAKEKLQQQITANLEWATRELFEVGNQPLGICHRRDKVRAIEVLAKMHGWYAPEKTNLSGEIKRGVTLNATYTVEPRPQEENPT